MEVEQKIDTPEMLDAFIERRNQIETTCDEVLDVMYNKLNRIPTSAELIKKMKTMKKDKNLNEEDRIFLAKLITANRWFVTVSLGVYLIEWTDERNIPYEYKERKGNGQI